MTAAAVMKRMALRWLKDERGATAAEFALIAVPFLGLLIAMMQTALVFFMGQILQNATAEAGRLVMTGQAVGMTPAQFQQAVCDRSHNFLDCTQLQVNVQTYSTFTAASQPAPMKNGKLDTSAFGFKPGTPGQIEVVQVFYAWPLGTDLLNLHLVNVNGDSRLLVATSVFRNEPY